MYFEKERRCARERSNPIAEASMRVARTVVLRSFAYGGICVIESHGPCRLWPFGCGGCSRGPGLLGSPGLALPQTDFSLDIDGEIITALERRARDVPEIGAVKSVDVAGRLVGLRGVERAIA